MNRSLVIFKPDAVSRGLVPALKAILTNYGFRLRGFELRDLSRSELHDHYAEHEAKPFFGELIDFMSSGSSCVMIVYGGEDTISKLRRLIGPTSPIMAPPGTIRGMLRLKGRPIRENLIHASDSPASAEREIKIFYRPEVSYPD
jgi:nucleoside-diphosphate kinase